VIGWLTPKSEHEQADGPGVNALEKCKTYGKIENLEMREKHPVVPIDFGSFCEWSKILVERI
jgi:hypothetical protein